MYQVEIDESPAYELLLSLAAYLDRQRHRTLELGGGWATQVRERLRPDFAATLAALPEGPHRQVLTPLDLLIWQCPTKQGIADVLKWLTTLSAGNMYELFARYAPKDKSWAWLPRDLTRWRDHAVDLLTTWQDQYFHDVDPTILNGLATDANAKRALLPTMAPEAVVEMATDGGYFEPTPNLDLVVLTPQHHYRPWSVSPAGFYQGVRFCYYPADVVPLLPDEPPPGLRRLTHALDDDNRLRILRVLAMAPRSFMEVVKATDLPKSSAHSHLMALRAAGLVRVHDRDGALSYSLRADALHGLEERLNAFFHSGSGT